MELASTSDPIAFAEFTRVLGKLIQESEAARQADELLLDASPLADSAPERRARRDLIDPILDALGWDLSPFSQSIVEEARLRKADHVRYGDYVGFALPPSRPILLVEAKSVDAPPPTAHSAWLAENVLATIPMPELIRVAIQYLTSPIGSPPLNQEWLSWLADVQDYVARIRDQHGAAPKVAVITSGNWWVVIIDPAATLLGPSPDPRAILFFPALQSLQDTTFHEALAWDHLVRRPLSTIDASDLPNYCVVDEIVWVGSANWTRKSEQGHPSYSYPRLEVGAALVVILRDGSILRATSRSATPLPNGRELLPAHLTEVGNLHAQLRAQAKMAMPEFPEPAEIPAADQYRKKAELLSWRFPGRIDTWLVTLGEATHFLTQDSTLADCPHHDQRTAEEDGHGLKHPIISPSTNPLAHFPSGSPLHCASQHVLDRKKGGRCKIGAFETALCCRVCSLKSICWTEDELANLPCGRHLKNHTA